VIFSIARRLIAGDVVDDPQRIHGVLDEFQQQRRDETKDDEDTRRHKLSLNCIATWRLSYILKL